MQAAIAEAEALAAGRRENELPALLCAFGRRSALFGPVGRLFLRNLVRAQAIANGCELEMSDVEFAIHHARVLRGEIELPELRGWFAARLRPFGQKGSTPRRPRG